MAIRPERVPGVRACICARTRVYVCVCFLGCVCVDVCVRVHVWGGPLVDPPLALCFHVGDADEGIGFPNNGQNLTSTGEFLLIAPFPPPESMLKGMRQCLA